MLPLVAMSGVWSFLLSKRYIGLACMRRLLELLSHLSRLTSRLPRKCAPRNKRRHTRHWDRACVCVQPARLPRRGGPGHACDGRITVIRIRPPASPDPSIDEAGLSRAPPRLFGGNNLLWLGARTSWKGTRASRSLNDRRCCPFQKERKPGR